MRVVAFCVLLAAVVAAFGFRVGSRQLAEAFVAQQVKNDEALYQKGPKRAHANWYFSFGVEEKPVLACLRAKNKEDLITVMKESLDHLNPNFRHDHPYMDYVAMADIYPSRGSVHYSRRWRTYEDLPAHSIQVPCGAQSAALYSGCYIVYYDDDFAGKILSAALWSSMNFSDDRSTTRTTSHGRQI